jgi:hypothetical protein
MAHRKRKARAREAFDDDLLATLAAEAEDWANESDRRRDALLGCLKKLRPDQAALMAERYEPGGCVNDMARRAGKSPKAVSEALARIRATLLQCVDQTLAALPVGRRPLLFNAGEAFPGSVVEAAGEVTADQAREPVVNTGGGVKAVWLNGTKVFESIRWTGWHPGKDRVPVRLREGRNEVRVEAVGPFFLSVTDTADWSLPPPP